MPSLINKVNELLYVRTKAEYDQDHFAVVVHIPVDELCIRSSLIGLVQNDKMMVIVASYIVRRLVACLDQGR
ncbi:hypothetical protein D3C71_2022980 [compost metagenome]